MQEIQLKHLTETEKIGEALGKVVAPGNVIVLSGELGAGKTTFTQSLGRGLGIKQRVKSPTYTLIREYQEGRLPLYHMDVYRLAEVEDDLGLEEYFEGDGVTVMEWGRVLASELPKDFLEIVIERVGAEEEARRIQLIPTGEKSQQLVVRWENELREEGLSLE